MSNHLLLVLVLANGACTTFHLPQVYVRGSYAPARTDAVGISRGEIVAFDMGLAGDLGEVGPLSLESEEESLAPSSVPRLVGDRAPCRFEVTCAWERAAIAEARARVIGGAR